MAVQTGEVVSTSQKEINQKEANQKDVNLEALGEEHINLVFALGNEDFGVDVNIVREIVRVPPFITRVPNAPSYIRGVINLRGTIVPVFDTQLKIDMPSTPLTEEARIVVLSVSDIMFGIIVNSVREVRTIYESQLEAATRLSSAMDKRYVTWVAKPADGRLILLLDISSLFDLDQILVEEA
ncbi:MAG: chemotaxis protein CheW [Synergistaceae bacterium]|nr:chemotaxis protein CheW [Synergistaceae bacterium]